MIRYREVTPDELFEMARLVVAAELDGVVNAFDPWARARGQYYDLAWKPRAGAEADDAFKQP